MTRASTAIFVSVLTLVVMSLWSLYSALMLSTTGQSWWMKQLAATVVGFATMMLVARVDHRRWRHGGWVWVVCLGVLTLLAMVLVIGTYRNGARRWLFGFQPSEFAKGAIILALAWYGARFQHRMHRFLYGVVGAGVMVVPFLALIFLEPDRGTTLFLAGLTGLMLMLAGVRWHHLMWIVLGAVLVVGPLLAADPLVRKRVSAFLNPEDHKGEAAYQNRQARLAFGEGGILGKGPGAGTMMRTIPEAHTDFILPVIGEEMGLVGTLLVVGGFLVILVNGVQIAGRASEVGDTFGMLLASGVTFLICTQAFFNIGIVSGLFPNKGLPLPLMSRGGTNMLMMLTLVGLLISVDRHTPVAAIATKGGVRKAKRSRNNPFGTRGRAGSSEEDLEWENPFGGKA